MKQERWRQIERVWDEALALHESGASPSLMSFR